MNKGWVWDEKQNYGTEAGKPIRLDKLALAGKTSKIIKFDLQEGIAFRECFYVVVIVN